MQSREALTYDDVLLVPKKTTLTSRDDANTATRLSRNLSLNIPIVSANMDTVTESQMAIAMALEGGIGIIHRFLSIEDQVAQVLKVKRSQGIIIDKPYILQTGSTLKVARMLMELHGVNGLLIVEQDGTLAGVLTRRDVQFETDNAKKVDSLMTPRTALITAPFGTSIEEARGILARSKVEKLPLVDESFKLKGLITAKDLIKREKHSSAAKDEKGRLLVGAAIGVKEGFLDRAVALIEAGCDVLVIDIAHGHSDQTINTIKRLREALGPVEIIAGNVATAEGTKDLILAGADAVKVGVGPGAVCTTRLVTGAGVPQLTAVMDSVRVANDFDVPIMADGGIQKSGDLSKALAAGASTIMVGSLFAGTDESPGIAIHKNGRRYKFYRGMASFDAAMGRQSKEIESKSHKAADKIVPEG